MTGLPYDETPRGPRTPTPPPPSPPPRRRRRPWWRRVLALVLTFAIVGVGLLAVAWFVLGPPIVVDPGTWVEVRFSPSYPDARPDRGGLRGALQPIELSHQEVLDALRTAAGDGRVEGILLRPEGFPGGWAQANELREALAGLRARGKRVVVHANGLSTVDLHLASVAERVVLSPEGVLLAGGVKADLMFVRRALDRIGVEVESVGVGDYKSAPEQFTADASSAASRQQIEELLDDVWSTWVGTVAEARGMTETRLSMLVERGLFDAEQALGTGLVDEVADLGRLVEVLGDPPRLEVLDYLAATGGPATLDGAPRIALVHVRGTIVPGRSQGGGLGGAMAGSETIVERLRRAREDDTIDAVVLRIDSPGGSALASDLVLREIQRVRAVKPVVASMGATAASGGYYVAMNTDRIVADPLTVTGSIGVFVLRPNLAGTYDKLDVSVETYARGSNAGLFDTTRPWTPGQRAAVQELLERFYDRFVGAVAAGRGLTREEAEMAAGGRVWSGRRALEVGLVDELGSRADAIRAAAELIGADPTIEPELVTYQPTPSILDQALAGALAGDVQAWRVAAGPWADALRASADLTALSDGTPQFAMPWRLTIR